MMREVRAEKNSKKATSKLDVRVPLIQFREWRRYHNTFEFLKSLINRLQCGSN